MNQPSILICTVGTSFFRPNLEELQNKLAQGTIDDKLKPLVLAYQQRDWTALAREFARLAPGDRVCGAEINSIASMIDKGYVPSRCGLFFLHSETDDGRRIGALLKAYCEGR